MRKLLIALLLAAVLLALCACGGANRPAGTDPATVPTVTTQSGGTEEVTQPAPATDPDHRHTYTDQVFAPTCTKEGYTLHTCQCGDSYTDTVVAATAHTYKETVLEPTCTEDGGRIFTCECGDTYKSEIQKAVGHQWGEWQTVKEPTTAAEGKAERKCSRCDQTESRKIDKLIENHTHQYTEKVTTQATCTAEGVKTFTCSCGSSYTESVAKKAHEYTKLTTDPTCTERGYVTAKCKNCTDSYIEKYIDAAGHSYKASVTDPTCTAKGYTAYTCKLCGHSYKDNEVAAIGHKMSAATCTAAEKCSVCGAIGSAATGHKWTEATCKAPKTCSVCKATEGTVSAHSYGQWTSSGAAQHTRKCAVCAKTETKNHNWNAGVVTKAATCKAEGVMTFTCGDCGQTRTETIGKTGHSYGKWSKISDSQHQRKCTVCSTTETANHSWDSGKISQAATCESAGSMTYTCVTCSAAKKEALSAIGHNWKYVSTSNGVTTEQCANCSKTRTVSAESHSHAAGNLETMTVAKAAAKCSALGNYSLEKYSRMTDVNIDICTKCGYVDFKSVKSIYTPQQETAKFIALAKSVRDPFIYQDSLNCGYTEEEAKESIEEYKHISDTICINHAIRRAKEISVDYSHNGAPDNCAELMTYGKHTIADAFQSWCNSTSHYNMMIAWAYPYVGFSRYIVGDPEFETITVYSVVILGYYDR